MGDLTEKKRPAAAALVESSSTSLSSLQSKRSKVTAALESEFLSPDLRLENRSNFLIFAATSSNSADTYSGKSQLVSRGSSNESLEIFNDGSRFVDLEAKSETDISACINSNKFSRENTLSSEARVEPVETRSPAKEQPSEAEIEEFFLAAEKQEQKRFAEKYNYDIVKDVPLEGRYRWVRLKRYE